MDANVWRLLAMRLTRTWNSRPRPTTCVPRPRPRPRTRCVNVKFLTGLFTSFLMFMFCECFYVRILIPVLTAFCLFMNKRICYCYYWQIDSSQRRMPNTQKMTIITKLAMHTAHDHNSQLKMEHFANTNDSSILSDILAQCWRTISHF